MKKDKTLDNAGAVMGKKLEGDKATSDKAAVVSYPIVDMSGKQVGTLDLDGAIFAAPILEPVVFETVQWQLSKRRQGTHHCISKGDMRGGGKKPWKQKGTGRARAGSSTSPLWVGGAVAHGPKSNPFGYETRVSKRSRRQALCSALTDMANNKAFIIVDSFSVPSGKTKDMSAALKKLGVSDKRIGFLVPKGASKIPSVKKASLGLRGESSEIRAMQNMDSVTLHPVDGLNVWDLLKADVVIGDKAQFEALQLQLSARETYATRSVRRERVLASCSEGTCSAGAGQ
jgi:large subunit ribosomal protein L4